MIVRVIRWLRWLKSKNCQCPSWCSDAQKLYKGFIGESSFYTSAATKQPSCHQQWLCPFPLCFGHLQWWHMSTSPPVQRNASVFGNQCHTVPIETGLNWCWFMGLIRDVSILPIECNRIGSWARQFQVWARLIAYLGVFIIISPPLNHNSQPCWHIPDSLHIDYRIRLSNTELSLLCLTSHRRLFAIPKTKNFFPGAPWILALAHQVVTVLQIDVASSQTNDCLPIVPHHICDIEVS